MELKKNSLHVCEIIDMNFYGLGVAKIEGAVLFVQYGVTGDKARIRIIKEAKNYYIARIENLLVPSPHRQEIACPYFKKCGGCLFWHIQYDYELKIKQNQVKNALHRAGLDDVSVGSVLSTGEILQYRNKAQYPLTEKDGHVQCGFFAPRTHTVCPVENCLIQDPAFSPIAARVCAYLEEHRISVYQEETGQGLVRHVFLRIGKSTGEIALCLVLSQDAFPEEAHFAAEMIKEFPSIASVSFNINPQNTNVILGKTTRTVWGKEKIDDILCGKQFQISPLSFYQVNHDAAELLYQTAFSLANFQKEEVLFDLYCGIGTISLCAPGNSKEIFGVEVVKEAVEDARRNALRNHVPNARYLCGDAKDAFSLLKNQDLEKTTVILDPPRKGLQEALITEIADHKIEKVLYISCNPETLARDLVLFRKKGYAFDFVQPVDLFPRTAHVECAVSIKSNIWKNMRTKNENKTQD